MMAGIDLSSDLYGGADGQDLSSSLYGQATKPTTAPLSLTDKVLKGMMDPVDGGAQLLTHVLPTSVVDAGNSLNNWLADKTGLFPKLPERTLSNLVTGEKTGVDGLIQKQEADYQARRVASGDTGIDGGRLVGNILSPVNWATGYTTGAATNAATKLPLLAGMTGKVLTGAASGAASSALAPVTSGDYADEKAKQLALGGVLGGATPMITAGIGRIVSPNASTNADVQLMKASGVQPTVGQTLGGAWNNAEEKLMSIPIVGDLIANGRNNARQQFNNAAINRATAPIGVQVEGAGQDAVKTAGDQISNFYNAAKSQLGNFQIDQQGAQELANLKGMTASLPQREQGMFNKLYQTVQSQFSGNGTILPDTYKTLDSKLTSDAARYSGSTDAYQQQLGDAVKELQRVLFTNAKRSNPQAAQMLDSADQAYANLVRIEGAAGAAKSSNGIFTPGQLLTAVKQADQSVRDRATARGTALMQDLATAGQNVLGNKVPDSGTAGRLGWGVLGAAAMKAPVPTVGGLLAGSAAYLPPIQSVLRAAVSSRPQSAQSVSQILNQASPYLAAPGAQIGLGLLSQ